MSPISTAPIHLRPTAPLAERALLPGDPGRALALAQVLIEQPRMFNHHRGLWGYSGLAVADGKQLTIQSTGMGGPSAAIVFEELIALGVRRAIRVGTCGALASDLQLGELVLATEAIAGDGASRALGAGERVGADPRLVSALVSAARPARSGAVLSTDLFYDPASRPAASWRADGPLAVEMESATLFALGARHEVAVACLLAVSDVFPAPGVRERISDHALLTAAERMGAAAVAALGGSFRGRSAQAQR
jgi:DeoD family purine-nucleoside phosphorylase